jgi:hypothetical protein
VIEDRHRRHELRESSRLRVVSRHTTVPAGLDVLQPAMPSWQRPSVRPGRRLAIPYHRRRHLLRVVCRLVPALVPVARWLA